ncbi:MULTISPECIES: ABC-2 transporter permease [Psychrobacillus]|uniref:ABC-2 transporter permease n=1 Tax=Psychrobacillus lasiicapitis TaxID=1636719 RepID=A0A544THJ0_9BACI|nr:MULTISPECIES: ABC-2 transporter permease [Psychrobacillus]MDI2589550.1 ABC-2 transporter permease [Psychrobacillus sp. NEAU-3TGS]TQR16927.1 ABC-2 transporter permease [Psychrobacillus lasiicapitis]GGA26004.1 permease [Psychrobacillus lasiicapitis]
MLNLIRKDIALQKKTLIILLLPLFAYLFFGSSTIWIGVLFCIAIIMQGFSMDEKSSSNLLFNSLPYTRKEIVSSKYVGACVFTFLVLATIFMGNLIIHKEMIQLEQLLFTMSIVMLFISFAFPFSYLLNSQYLMIAFAVLFVLYFIIVNMFIPNLNDRIRELVQTALSFDNSLLYLIVVVSVLLIYIVSWMLSIRIYSKKVF